MRDERGTVLLGSVLACVACRTPAYAVPCDGEVVLGWDAEDAPQGPPQLLTFVVSQVKLDTRTDRLSMVESLDTSADNAHTGFDVDCRTSDANDMLGCAVPDYYAKIDLDQHSPLGCARSSPSCKGGVDNSLLALGDALSVTFGDVNETEKSQLARSQNVTIVRVLDVNSLREDVAVTVKFYRGVPAFQTGCNALAPGRPYRIHTDSLTTGSADIESALATYQGEIRGGRLRVQGSAPLKLPFGAIELNLQHMKFRVDLDANGGRNGNLGGWMKGQDFLFTIQPISPPNSILIAFLPAFLDVMDPDLSGTPMEQCLNADPRRPETWGGFSVGVGVSLLPATLESTIPISEPQPGNCGSAPVGQDR